MARDIKARPATATRAGERVHERYDGEDWQDAGQLIQPGEGAFPEGRIHQGGGDRILPEDVVAHRAAGEKPPADAQAISQRRKRDDVLRKALPAARAAVD